MRCLIRPSAECSNGISLAGITFCRFLYSRRDSLAAATSSARKLQVFVLSRATSRSSNAFAILLLPYSFLPRVSEISRWLEILVALGRRARRIRHDFLEDKIHEMEQRLGLEHEQ